MVCIAAGRMTAHCLRLTDVADCYSFVRNSRITKMIIHQLRNNCKYFFTLGIQSKVTSVGSVDPLHFDLRPARVCLSLRWVGRLRLLRYSLERSPALRTIEREPQANPSVCIHSALQV